MICNRIGKGMGPAPLSGRHAVFSAARWLGVILACLLGLTVQTSAQASGVQKSAPPTAGVDWKDLDQRIEKARAAGNYKEAIALVQKKLSLQRQRLGKVHDDIAESLTSLATLQADADDYAAAQKTCQECLALETQLHGAKHYRTVDASWRLKRAERLSVLSPEQRRRYTQTFVLQDTLAT